MFDNSIFDILLLLFSDVSYRSCYQIYRDIITKEGYQYLMKGLLPRLIAVPSMMSVFYVINEELEKLFNS